MVSNENFEDVMKALGKFHPYAKYLNFGLTGKKVPCCSNQSDRLKDKVSKKGKSKQKV